MCSCCQLVPPERPLAWRRYEPGEPQLERDQYNGTVSDAWRRGIRNVVPYIALGCGWISPGFEFDRDGTMTHHGSFAHFLDYDKRYSGTEMVNPRFDAVAEAMGAKGMYCNKEADLDRVLKEFVEYDDGPVVLEVFVDKKEHVFPMVPAGRGLSDMILGTEDK